MRSKTVWILAILGCFYLHEAEAGQTWTEVVRVGNMPPDAKPIAKCTDVRNSTAVDAKLLNHYQYCKVNNSVDFGVGASVSG